MINFVTRPRRARLLALLLAVTLLAPNSSRVSVAAEEASAAGESSTESVRGRIVWLYEALQRRYGAKAVPEAQQRILALETHDGKLFPIFEDVRGRSFRKDARLRELEDCELLVRRQPGSPMVQVIRVYSHEKGRKLDVYYWCEVCAIAMYELKPCDCCQAPIVLRRKSIDGK